MMIPTRLTLAALCAGLLAAAPTASAQNVALGKPVSASAGVTNSSGNPDRITDGFFNPEGTYWQTNSMWWTGTAPTVSVDLGAAYTLTGFTIQADNNDTYLLEFSNDAGATWSTAWAVPTMYNGGGMATRSTTLGSSIVADQLRFSATGGDNFYSISQLEADGTAVVATPEPATVGLLAIGLTALVPVVRRRR